jgi:hypothetical protein
MFLLLWDEDVIFKKMEDKGKVQKSRVEGNKTRRNERKTKA